MHDDKYIEREIYIYIDRYIITYLYLNLFIFIIYIYKYIYIYLNIYIYIFKYRYIHIFKYTQMEIVKEIPNLPVPSFLGSSHWVVGNVGFVRTDLLGFRN